MRIQIKKRNLEAESLIVSLGLREYPGGGYYVCTNSSTDVYPQMSVVMYLLVCEEVMTFHQFQSDEVWYLHSGRGMHIHQFLPDGTYRKQILSPEIDKKITIERNTWFAVENIDINRYTLVSCTCSPSFSCDGIELAKKEELFQQYPNHKDIINKFCS